MLIHSSIQQVVIEGLPSDKQSSMPLGTAVNQQSSALRLLKFLSEEASKSKCKYTVCQVWKKQSRIRGIRIVVVRKCSVVLYSIVGEIFIDKMAICLAI